MAEVVDHRVRNILAALRGHLELAHESATSEVTGREDLVEDLSNALDALGRLESRLGVHVDSGRRGGSATTEPGDA